MNSGGKDRDYSAFANDKVSRCALRIKGLLPKVTLDQQVPTRILILS